jgi:hypothetical protein
MAVEKNHPIPVHKVVECVILPELNTDSNALASLAQVGRDVVLDGEIRFLLREYVSSIGRLYRVNPFHSFGTKDPRLVPPALMLPFGFCSFLWNTRVSCMLQWPQVTFMKGIDTLTLSHR